jgi:hypothetical protein
MLVRKDGGVIPHVSFRKMVEERMSEGLLGIDVNEKSVGIAIVRLRFIKIDVSGVKYVRDHYFRKWRSIQSKTSGGD